MKRSKFPTLLRTPIAVIAVLVITATSTVAEVPRKTAAALQNRSPEKLLIEVQTVEKKRNGAGGFDLEINARVLEVEESETELTKGDSLTIRYWLHDPEKPLEPGSYPMEIEKGKTYRAYVGPPARAYPLYEFMSSRLTNQIRHGHQGRGTLFSYNEKCSFGKITFDLSHDDPTATYDVVNIDNETVHSFTLKRSQLK